MSIARVGIIGTGNISMAYFHGSAKATGVQIVAAADIDVSRATAKVAEAASKLTEWNAPGDTFAKVKTSTVKELLANPDVDIVLNLTVPKAHLEVSLAAIDAGKHVYLEKPLGVSREEGRKMITAAKAKNVRVGCAPDTFLGGGIQTCRKLIDDGWIGTPVAATAFMTCGGHENWHPSPEFYYEVGGGPMFDMGPYYLTALVNMLGPIKRVSGMARATFPTRTITSQPKFGKVVDVETPTHIASTMEFVSGPIATTIMSFDAKFAQLPLLQVIGTEGTLLCPDPNGFGGPIKFKKPGMADWQDIPTLLPNNSRFFGLLDMASAIAKNRPHRASGDLAYHVLDAMQASLEAGAQGKTIDLTTTVERPAAVPLGLREWTID